MLDTAGAEVTPRENCPAAYTPSFRWPVLTSGDALCLLCWEVLSAQNFAFLPSLQGSSALALLASGGGGDRSWLGGHVLDVWQHPWPVPNRCL